MDLKASHARAASTLERARLRRYHRPASTACAALLVLALLSSAAPVIAQSAAPSSLSHGDTVVVSLREARAAALRANPELLAARLDTAVARGQLRQAGIFRYNPSADVLAGVGGNGAEPGVSQEIELFGQRGARRSAGRAGVARARAGVTNVARLTIGEVDRTFYRLISAARRTELADEVLQLNQRLTSVAQRQLAEGEISRLDLNLALVELGRSRSRALATRRERERVATELGRLLGLAQGSVVVPAVDSTQHIPAPDTTSVIPRDLVAVGGRTLDVDSLTALALALRPDLVAQSAAVRQAAGEARVARREALPNLLLRAASEPRSTGSGRVVRPGVGITLPFFNRNQGEVQARRAATQQAELGRAALATRVRAEILTSVTTYRSAAAEVEVLETTVLAPARQNRRLLETAYREGKVGLPVLLLIRNQVIDAELDYWAAWLEEREALSSLAEATGQNLGGAP